MADNAGFDTVAQTTLFWSADGVTYVPVSAANPLPTTGGGGGGGSTNATIVAPLGPQTDANAVAVNLSTDQTDIYSGTEAVKVAIINPADGTPLQYNTPTNVVGPTAVGSAAANPPILVAGTANATATGNVQVLKVDATGVASVNTAQVNGVTVLTGTGATGTGAQRVTVSVDSATVAGSASLPAGSNVIGHVIADSGSTTAVTGTVTVAGPAASGASVSGNPLLTGGRAATTNPTAVTDGQAIAVQLTKTGKVVTVEARRDAIGVQDTTITASTAETTIVTQTTSIFNDLYGLILANSSATATNVTIKDSTGGTTRAVIYVPAGDTRGFMLPAGSGIPQATVNTNWTATSSASITSLFVTALFVANV